MKSRRRKLSIALTTFVGCALGAWVVSFVVRSKDLYDTTKAGKRGWRGTVYQSDPILGLAPIPGARADELLRPLPEVPSRIDARGFRVPLDEPDAAPIVRPAFLALGCSVTYGSCVRAEETFAFRVAREFGGTCLNAGLCSGGAAQELILARRLIPEYKPDYVLLQYAPWLIQRSLTPYAPTFAGAIPVPFFVADANGARLHEPVFTSIVLRLPTHEYRDSERSFTDFVSFTSRVGVPLLAHDDVYGGWTALRRAFGHVPPFANPEQVDALVYGEIGALCKQHGAKLVVVAFEEGGASRVVPEAIRDLGVPIAYGTSRLHAELSEVSRVAFNQAFLHTAGDPPVLVDRHPNARAHALIADEIVKVMRGAK